LSIKNVLVYPIIKNAVKYIRKFFRNHAKPALALVIGKTVKMIAPKNAVEIATTKLSPNAEIVSEIIKKKIVGNSVKLTSILLPPICLSGPLSFHIRRGEKLNY
jgi:hypothetical protein